MAAPGSKRLDGKGLYCTWDCLASGIKMGLAERTEDGADDVVIVSGDAVKLGTSEDSQKPSSSVLHRAHSNTIAEERLED